MKWPPLTQLRPLIQLPNDFELHQMEAAEIPKVIACLKKWYPTLQVGSEARHLSSKFYTSLTYLRHGKRSAPIFPFLIKSKSGKIVGYYSLEVNRLAKSMSGLLGVIDPQLRSRGLSEIFAPLVLEIAKLMQIELLHGFVTLQHPYVQRSFEKHGFVPVGIVPASDQFLFEGGVVKRMPEVLYAKVLVGEEKLAAVSRSSMTPKVQALWDHLFER